MADNIEAVGLELDTRDYERALLRAERRINSLEDEFDDLTRKGKRQQDMFSGLEKRVIGFVGAYLGLRQAARAGRAIFETNVELEQLEARLTSITGSADAAAQAFDMITGFAADTPFEIQNLTEAFTTLQAAGITPTEDMMRDLGNFAAAMGRDITDLVQAILRASQGGTERLRESFFIPISKEGDKLKISFRGMSETIEADSESLIDHFRELAETNFADGMSRQMATMGGAISNLEDSTTILIKEIGDAGLNGQINRLIRTLDKAIQDGDDFAEVLGESLASGVSTATDAMEVFVRHQETIIAGFEMLFALGVGAGVARITTRLVALAAGANLGAVALRALTGTFAALGGPLGIAAAAMIFFAGHEEDASEAARELRDEVDELVDSLDDLSQAEISARVEGLTSQFVALGEQIRERQRELRELADQEVSGAGGLGVEQAQEQARIQSELDDLRRRQAIAGEGLTTAAGALGGAAGEDAKTPAAPDAAASQAADALDSVTSSLEEQIVKLKEGERALLAYRLAQEGVGKEGVKQALNLFDQVEALEAEKDAREEAEKAAERQAEAIQSTIEGLEAQNLELRLGEAALLRHQLRAQGATEAQIEMAVSLLRANERIREQIQAQEDAERRAEQELQRLEATAETLAEGMSDALVGVFDDAGEAVHEFVELALRELQRLVLMQGIVEPLGGAILDILLPIAGAAAGGGGTGAELGRGSFPTGRKVGSIASPVDSGALVVNLNQTLNFPSLDAPHVAEMMDRNRGAVASAAIEAIQESEHARQALLAG